MKIILQVIFKYDTLNKVTNGKEKTLLKIAMLMLFVFAPILTLLTACGGSSPKYFYFPVDALPAHIEQISVLSTTGGKGFDNKGEFLGNGDVAEVRFFIEEGYTIGSLKVLSNGEELNISQESDTNGYSATFTPTEDFAITFTGAVAPKVANIHLAVRSAMYPNYHDRIMVEIDKYELFGLKKETMNFAEFKEAVENIESSLAQINYDTPITVSIYTVGAYDFAISRSTSVRILNDDNYPGIGYNDQVEKIIDEKNQKYGYKHTIRFSENNTITIQDKVEEEYRVAFVDGWEGVSMNKDLFTLSVNGENRTTTSGYESIQGVVKFSDFTGTELPKLKINFLKYSDENYKNYYDALTFNIGGTQAQRSVDDSYIEIEFDKYYNYSFEHDRYVISTNVLELLKTMDMVTEKSYRIVDKIEMDGAENSSQYVTIETSELIKDKSVGRHGEIVYFLKNEFLTFTINFSSEVNYEFVRFGEFLVNVDSSSNSDIIVTKEQYGYDGETQASRFIIKVRAFVATEKIEFFTNNPDP